MRLTLSIVCGLVFAAALHAQQQPILAPAPRVTQLSPVGGKVGTTLELTVTGLDMEEPQSLWFSHPGIKSEFIPPPPPPVDPKTKEPPKQPPPRNPTVPHATKFKVTIAPDVPLGIHDVRVVNSKGISNPRAFVVGDLTEVMEKEGNNDIGEAQKIELNCTVNGSFATGTDVDLFSFTGKAKQRVIISCLAFSIDSRARPLIEVYRPDGSRLAANRNYHYTDALADVTLPADGEYYIRLSEFTYLGVTGEHFYRLSVTTGPWIDAVFPSVLVPGQANTVTIYGRNLPGGQPDPTAQADGQVLEKMQTTITPPGDPASRSKLAYSGAIHSRSTGVDGFEYRLSSPVGKSNPVLLSYAEQPLVLEREGNDTAETAQAVPFPCVIAGRIDRENDRDWYSFTAKQGQTITIELLSERLGTPADLFMRVRNPAGKGTDLAELDDDNDEFVQRFQFPTRTFDPPRYTFVAPADGPYQVMVGSRNSATLFGPRQSYRLTIAPPQPDFRLVAMPSDSTRPDAHILNRDGTIWLDIFVWRRGGFNGPIRLEAEGLPPGVTCPPGQWIGPDLQQATLVLRAAPDAPDSVASFRIKGIASINGQNVVHEARPASIIVGAQPPIVSISRLERDLVLAVRDKAPWKLTVEKNTYTVKQGEKLTLPFKVQRLSPDTKAPVTVGSFIPVQNVPPIPFVLPAGSVTFNNNQVVTVPPDKSEGAGVIDVKANAKVGTYTLVLRGTTAVQINRNPAQPNAKVPVNFTQASDPILLTILPTALGQFTVAAPPPLKTGSMIELVVNVNRLNNFVGEYKLKLIVPENLKDISADEVTLPAGQNQAKLLVKAGDNAPAGNFQNLPLQIVGIYTPLVGEPVAIPHEVKVNLTVQKAK